MSGRDFQAGDLVEWGLCDGSSGRARIVDLVGEDLVTLSGHGDRPFNVCYLAHTSETTPSATATRIAAECDALKAMLLAKNAAYGDSATDPVRVFSGSSPSEQIRVRIDDKISRLSRGHAMADESMRDTVRDLIGYLVLLLIVEES